MEADEILARRYFDQWLRPGLGDTSENGIDKLREGYVRFALQNPEMLRALRIIYG